MSIFYVSLVNDLQGCYLKFQAYNDWSVRKYLEKYYQTLDGTWKLPWCGIYTSEQFSEFDAKFIEHIIDRTSVYVEPFNERVENQKEE